MNQITTYVLQKDKTTKVLERLYVLKSRDGMKELNPHGKHIG